MIGMRILHATQPTEAGVPTVVRQLARDQRDHGIEVVVAAPEGEPLAEWLDQDRIPHQTWKATRNPGPSVLRETRELGRIIREVAPDLVHLHSAKAGLAGRLALKGRLPTIFQPHAWSFEAVEGPVAAAATRWERYAVRWTDIFVCVSDDERSSAARAGLRGRMEVLPNGVDLTVFAPPRAGDREEARAALGLPARPLVVCVGRLTRQKGQDLLLRALPELRARVPDVRVVLVGDGPDASALRAAAPPGVLFAGQRSDVRRWLTAADVVALPSRWEAGSLVVLEAMAAGRSVVSTTVAGTPSLLEGAGAVVPIDDAGALAQALAERLLDPAVAGVEGAQGRRRVESTYNQETTAARVRVLYSEVLASVSAIPRRPAAASR
jgi:glycosyltransferase involved in cell wall biosynthesis